MGVFGIQNWKFINRGDNQKVFFIRDITERLWSGYENLRYFYYDVVNINQYE